MLVGSVERGGLELGWFRLRKRSGVSCSNLLRCEGRLECPQKQRLWCRITVVGL